MPPNAVYNKLVTCTMHRETPTSYIAKRNATHRMFDEKMASTAAATWLMSGCLCITSCAVTTSFDSLARFATACQTLCTPIDKFETLKRCVLTAILSVLAFDKSFNLGVIYVTASVYKNVVLHQKCTSDHPLFLGPIFIHGHSDMMTYGLFFSHLAHLFIDCDQHQLTLGSDEELAVYASAFPACCTHLVYTTHAAERGQMA